MPRRRIPGMVAAMNQPSLPKPESAAADDIVRRLATVRARIAAVAKAAGRAPGDIALVAVGKGHGVAAVTPALSSIRSTQRLSARAPAVMVLPQASNHRRESVENMGIKDRLQSRRVDGVRSRWFGECIERNEV